MSARLAIHVLDDDPARRAHVARCAYQLGHHVGAYADLDELAGSAPDGGVVLALEDGVEGGVSGLMRRLEREGGWLPVIAIGSSPSIDKAVSAIKQGALDYVPWPLEPDRLRRAIDEAAVEAQQVREQRLRQTDARARLARLSARESEVIERMAEGLTNKEIGRNLGISPRTVEIHRMNALARLGARHSAGALRMRLEAGSMA